MSSIPKMRVIRNHNTEEIEYFELYTFPEQDVPRVLA